MLIGTIFLGIPPPFIIGHKNKRLGSQNIGQDTGELQVEGSIP